MNVFLLLLLLGETGFCGGSGLLRRERASAAGAGELSGGRIEVEGAIDTSKRKAPHPHEAGRGATAKPAGAIREPRRQCGALPAGAKR
jgi:hypothetical protein